MMISVDIGSTWTKGAVFAPEDGQLTLVDRVSTATTTGDLSRCFEKILERLRPVAGEAAPVVCSSSAHGGLKIIALGIVPELTLESARLAALSAGGKLMKAYAYRLNTSDIEEIQAADPDILLFTGGTDGGNQSYLRHNAQMIAESELACPILYAGNRDLTDFIKDALGHKQLLLAPNVLPDLDTPSPQGARDMIRDTFMSSIIQGKGLSKIVDLTGAAPIPTPASVFDYVSLVDEHNIFEGDFALVDMGGATTDYYSAVKETKGDRVIHKGIREPRIKRSVEGDLGMRVSALSALETDKAGFLNHCSDQGHDPQAVLAYIEKINQNTAHIPSDPREKEWDTLLAGLCTVTATVRHSGTRQERFTTSGPVFIEAGRDLTQVKTIIGTGGYLSQFKDSPVAAYPVPALTPKGEEILSPETYRYYHDHRYLIPLLANAARQYPQAAAASLLPNLEG